PPRLCPRDHPRVRRRRARRRGRDPSDIPAEQEMTQNVRPPGRSRGTVEIVGVPMDLGGNRRGVDMGPSGIRYAGLANKLSEIGYRVRDRGNVRVKDPDEGRPMHMYEKYEGESR